MTSTPALPDDENGDVLRRMQSSGDDFSKPRDIDFTVVLPSEAAAEQFAQHFGELGYTIHAEKSDCVAGLPWDILVTRHMLPTHEGITAFEIELERIATPLGGRNDGWGCFGQ